MDKIILIYVGAFIALAISMILIVLQADKKIEDLENRNKNTQNLLIEQNAKIFEYREKLGEKQSH